MSKLLRSLGTGSLGSKKSATISYHPKSIVFETPTALGTSYPDPAQAIFTIEEGDLPSFDGDNLLGDSVFSDAYRILGIAFFTRSTSGATDYLYMQSFTSGTTWSSWSTSLPYSGFYTSFPKKSLTKFTCKPTTFAIGTEVKLRFKNTATDAGTTIDSAHIIIYPAWLGKGAAEDVINLVVEGSNETLLNGKTAQPGSHNVLAIRNSYAAGNQVPPFAASTHSFHSLYGIQATPAATGSYTDTDYSAADTYVQPMLPTYISFTPIK